jgi:hypothetical protein
VPPGIVLHLLPNLSGWKLGIQPKHSVLCKMAWRRGQKVWKIAFLGHFEHEVVFGRGIAYCVCAGSSCDISLLQAHALYGGALMQLCCIFCAENVSIFISVFSFIMAVLKFVEMGMSHHGEVQHRDDEGENGDED